MYQDIINDAFDLYFLLKKLVVDHTIENIFKKIKI